jgi:hypothetical protein
MILIAATAIGLLPASWAIGPLASRMGQVHWTRLAEESYRDYLIHDTTLIPAIVSRLFEAVIFFPIVYTVVLLILRLIPPRPPLRDLARQPGLWACGIATMAMAPMIWLHYFRPVIISGAVGLAWLVLAASGRWRSESSWIDKAGRALGFTWLAMLPPFAWFAWRG